MCIDSDIAGVQYLLYELVRDCVSGVGGLGMVGDIEGVEGRQRKGPGVENGRYGGIGEEYKDQDVGKGRRIAEGDRYGGIGVDSSEGRAGSEDCSHTGIEKRVAGSAKIVVRRMSGPEEMSIICWLLSH